MAVAMRRAQRWAARVLTAGGVLGVALMVVGVALTAAWGPTGSRAGDAAPGAPADRAGHTIVSLAQAARALTHRPIDPAGLSALGTVALFLTPMVAVAFAGAAFYLDHDRRFAAVAGIVVAVLVLSLWLGRA
jgi:uncharacterized membrane protein